MVTSPPTDFPPATGISRGGGSAGEVPAPVDAAVVGGTVLGAAVSVAVAVAAVDGASGVVASTDDTAAEFDRSSSSEPGRTTRNATTIATRAPTAIRTRVVADTVLPR
jgi:hypothetical protein